VKAGNTISTSFDQYAEIPPLVTQMIRVGEESGRLDFLLKSTASFYQRDVDNLFENFVSLIEPALIVFLGLGVAFIVAAVLVPLYNLSTIL
ncbi:MAG: type II secretion system F family protein, partial [Patescibacteria group bacterium]